MNIRLLTVGLAIGCAVVGTVAAPARTAPELRLPDLVPAEESLRDHFVEEVRGRTLLRFSGGMVNIGEGPLEVVGKARRPSSRLAAYQAISVQGSRRKRETRIGTCSFNPELQKWDVVTVAAYRLRDTTGTLVSSNDKVSFCVIDEHLRDQDLPGAPPMRRYGSCPSGRKRTSLKVGLSVGWADVYEWTRDGQALDITDVLPGAYTLEMELNAEGVMQEKSRENNRLSIPVTL